MLGLCFKGSKSKGQATRKEPSQPLLQVMERAKSSWYRKDKFRLFLGLHDTGWKGCSFIFSSLFTLERSHRDKDYPRNNIAVGDGLPAKAELLLQKRVRKSHVSILRTTSTIVGKIRTDLREEAGL